MHFGFSGPWAASADPGRSGHHWSSFLVPRAITLTPLLLPSRPQRPNPNPNPNSTKKKSLVFFFFIRKIEFGFGLGLGLGFWGQGGNSNCCPRSRKGGEAPHLASLSLWGGLGAFGVALGLPWGSFGDGLRAARNLPKDIPQERLKACKKVVFAIRQW